MNVLRAAGYAPAAALEQPQARTAVASRQASRVAFHAALWTLGAGVVYWAFGHQLVHDVYGRLADAFLNGRLHVSTVGGLELVPFGDGSLAYVPFPPVPALTYMPAQALGLRVSSAGMTAALGAVGVGLAYLLLTRLSVRPLTAGIITAGLATSTFGWAAASGGTWLYAQVLAFTLALAALHLAVRGRWPLLAGLLLGLAGGSRLPVALMLPLLLYLYRAQRWRAWLPLAAGAAAVALPLALYNLARFGSPLDFGYADILSFFHPGYTVLAESWFSEGLLSWTYIPRSLGVMLFGWFEIEPGFPWLKPPISGLSIAITAPVFLLALRAPRSRLALAAWGTAALVMLPNLAHGSWGFWQYGYRFLIDAMPMLLLLLAMAYRDRRPDLWLAGLVVLGAAANAYWFVANHLLHFVMGGLPFAY